MKTLRVLLFAFTGLLVLHLHAQQVGMLMHSLVDDRWSLDQQLFSNRVSDLGGEPVVKLAQGNADRQLAQARELIEAGINVLVVVPVDAQKASAIVDLADANDVSIIAYDRMIVNPGVDLYLSYDNLEVGQMQAQSAIDNVQSGDFILINGPVHDHNAVKFREGQMKVLSPWVEKGKITIREDIVLDDWGEVNAFITLLDIFSDIQGVTAIIAANDGIALAVASAITDMNALQSIYLTGQDADLGAIKNIMKGYQNMTVYKPIAPLAELAAEMALKFANGENPEVDVSTVAGIEVPTVLLRPKVVTKDNVKETVVADGHVKMSEVVE